MFRTQLHLNLVMSRTLTTGFYFNTSQAPNCENITKLAEYCSAYLLTFLPSMDVHVLILIQVRLIANHVFLLPLSPTPFHSHEALQEN